MDRAVADAAAAGVSEPDTVQITSPVSSRVVRGDDSTHPQLILSDAYGARPDGRSTRDIRAISAEVDLLPVVHCSAVFSRGDTQVLCTATLGPMELAQTLRPADGAVLRKQFFLHYDFPPYCTNEVGKVRAGNAHYICISIL